jgi:hypothetical protein
MRELSVVEQRYQAVLAVLRTVAEVAVLELRRSHPSWGPRRPHFELSKRELESLPRFWLSRYPPMESGRTDPSPGHQQVALTEQPCQPRGEPKQPLPRLRLGAQALGVH